MQSLSRSLRPPERDWWAKKLEIWIWFSFSQISNLKSLGFFSSKYLRTYVLHKGLWGIFANIFGLFTTHSFTNSKNNLPSFGTVNVVTFEICSRAGECTLTVHPVLSLDVFETPRGCRGSKGMDNIIRSCPLAEISRFF